MKKLIGEDSRREGRVLPKLWREADGQHVEAREEVPAAGCAAGCLEEARASLRSWPTSLSHPFRRLKLAGDYKERLQEKDEERTLATEACNEYRLPFLSSIVLYVSLFNALSLNVLAEMLPNTL